MIIKYIIFALWLTIGMTGMIVMCLFLIETIRDIIYDRRNRYKNLLKSAYVDLCYSIVGIISYSGIVTFLTINLIK